MGYLRMVYAGGQVAFETDSAGSIGLRYTWGPGADNLLAIQDESGNHFYATTDRLGSVRTLAKRDGTWLLTRRWAPYGSEISRDSSASFTWGARLRYGWTGREYDAETGLYFHRARYYSPAVGRFVQEDPIASSTSAYAYVNGSPLEATDPSGMMMSYEMRMTDYRMDEILKRNNPGDDGLQFELPSGGGGGGSGSLELVAQRADGTEVSCSSIPEQCAAFLEQNGDVLMSNPAVFAQLVNNLEASPWDSKYPLYQREVGGWCSSTQCTMKIGSINGMGKRLGKQPQDAILGYHTHPNVGLPGVDGRSMVYGVKASDSDIGHAGAAHYTVPMYVISYYGVDRYTIDYSGPQLRYTRCAVLGTGDRCP